MGFGGVISGISGIGAAAVLLLGPGHASAGDAHVPTVTATADCDGTVVVEYSSFLYGGEYTEQGRVIFTVGSVEVARQALDDRPSAQGRTDISGTITQTGFTPGDTVIIDVGWNNRPSGYIRRGATTVDIPAECPEDTTTTTAPAGAAPSLPDTGGTDVRLGRLAATVVLAGGALVSMTRRGAR